MLRHALARPAPGRPDPGPDPGPLTCCESGVGRSPARGPSIDVTAFGDQRLTNKASVTTAAFSTTSGNVLLLAFVAAGDSAPGNTVTSVTGAGVTWQLVARTNAQRGTAEIWRAWATSVLKRVSVTATLAQKAPSSITVVGFRNADATGVNGVGAFGAIKSAAASAGAPTIR